MNKKTFNLQEHLSLEHKISPFQTYLKEIVYGATDGIITTFAVVAGASGANLNSPLSTLPVLIVLLFGLANLFADASSMALSNFLSLRAEKDVYKSEEEKELSEIRAHPEMEKKETIEILKIKGFTAPQAEKLTAIYATNEKYWLSFMMNHELELPNPKGENPLSTSLATFLAFISFGALPLLPYIFLPHFGNIFLISAVTAITALILLGLMRWRVTVDNPMRSILEIVAVGTVAAVIAYLVGTLFRI